MNLNDSASASGEKMENQNSSEFAALSRARTVEGLAHRLGSNRHLVTTDLVTRGVSYRSQGRKTAWTHEVDQTSALADGFRAHHCEVAF